MPNSAKIVLVAEDNIESRLLIELYLKKLGLSYHSHADGQALCAAVEKQGYDLLIVDAGLPIVDGVSAVKRIRQSGFINPIICVSANKTEADQNNYLAAGFTDFLPKPFVSAAFFELVSKLLKIELPERSKIASNEEDWQELVSKFKSTLLERVTQLESSINAKDLKLSAFLAHRLRGAAMFGLQDISDAAGQIEIACRDGDLKKASSVVTSLFSAAKQHSR